MEVDVVSPISAEAEIKQYTLVGDDIYIKRYTNENIPDWYRQLVSDIISQDNTITDMNAAISYLSTLPAGYNHMITELQNADATTNTSLQSLVTTTGDHTAAIGNLQITKVDADGAAAIARTTIGSYFADGSAGAWFDNQISTYASDISANAMNISTLSATLDGQSVRIDTVEDVAINASGWSANASKLITSPDGSITGWSFGDGSNVKSYFQIQATNFKISDGATGYTPFSIVGSDILFNGKVTFTNVTGSLTTTQQSSINTSNITNGAGWTDNTVANQAIVNAAAANTAADNALIAANNAQTTANTASTNATAALNQLTNIASDNILSVVEKSAVIADYAVITAEQIGIDSQATNYGITTEKTSYDTAITSLTTYLNGLTTPYAWNSVSGETTIVGTTFRQKFNDVYTARQTLLDKIAALAKTLADNAGSAANNAQTAADNAQSAANTANTNATNALSQLTDIASDNILSPVEKPVAMSDYDVITSEQSGIDAQATSYGITTEKTAYDDAVSALTTYLNTLTSPVAWNNTSGNTIIVGSTFRQKFNDVYTTRQTLLNKIYANAKAIADSKLSSFDDLAALINSNTTTIDGGKITTGSITASQILSNTITASQIASNTITASQIASNTITASNIASETITSTQIASDTITSSNIAANAITASEISAGAVTSSKISVSSLSAINATLGTVSAGTLSASKFQVNGLVAFNGSYPNNTAPIVISQFQNWTGTTNQTLTFYGASYSSGHRADRFVASTTKFMVDFNITTPTSWASSYAYIDVTVSGSGITSQTVRIRSQNPSATLSLAASTSQTTSVSFSVSFTVSGSAETPTCTLRAFGFNTE